MDRRLNCWLLLYRRQAVLQALAAQEADAALVAPKRLEPPLLREEQRLLPAAREAVEREARLRRRLPLAVNGSRLQGDPGTDYSVPGPRTP